MKEWSPEQTLLIRQHLASLSKHPLFSQAERLLVFLHYIVEAELNGESSKLNQNAIAIDVFERDADFDPSSDSIVRVEAGRLRAKLREYYESTDSDDGVRIEQPKGSYAPLFHFDISTATSVTDSLAAASPGTKSSWRHPKLVALAMFVALTLVYTFLNRTDEDRSEIRASTTEETQNERESAPVSVALNKTPSIAVLPFTNMSADPQQEYFSDGIAEEILNALAQLPDLRVAARTSSFYFKGKDVDLETISEKLKVNYAVEGSVRRSVDRLRITAKLIDAQSGFQLWSEVYDRRLEDVFVIQEEIARAIVHALRLQLDDHSGQLITIGTRSVGAYNLFLQGKAPVIGSSSYSVNRSIQLFEKATAIDPNFVDAHAYLAYSHISRHYFTRYESIAADIKKSYKQALALNPKHSAALCAKAYDVVFSEWDWTAAGELFKKAIQPGTVEAPCTDLYSFWYLMALSRHTDALDYLNKIEKLDPLNITIKWILSSAVRFSGDYVSAQKMMASVLEVNPENVPGLYDVASSLIHAGMLEEAERIVIRLENLDDPAAPQFATNQRIQLEVVRGDAALAAATFDAALKDAENDTNPSPGLWNQLGLSAVLLGKLDHAINLFERAFREGAPGVVMTRAILTTMPTYIENGSKLMARSDFQAFLAKMNLDDESIMQYGEASE